MYRVELTKQREELGNQVEEMQGKDLKKKKKGHTAALLL